MQEVRDNYTHIATAGAAKRPDNPIRELLVLPPSLRSNSATELKKRVVAPLHARGDLARIAWITRWYTPRPPIGQSYGVVPTYVSRRAVPAVHMHR